MATPINVAHLLPWDGVGGTEHATLRIARAMQPEGFRSIAFCLDTAPPVECFFREAGLETARWRIRHPDARRMVGFILEAVRLSQEFRRRSVHLVHCADVRAASTVGAVAAKLAGVPVLCHVRNHNEMRWKPSRRTLPAVDRFLFVSHDTWRSFGYDVPAERGVVIYDGIEVSSLEDGEEVREVRRELGIPGGSPIVGMVARVEPQKDFRTLARAAARILAAEPDARILVVGGHSETEEQRQHFKEVKRWITESGVESSVIFTGFRSDVVRLLRAMDAFVLSTHWEGLPLVILEAMAQARPVVATAVCGIPEIVRNGETGFLVPHEDDASLADRVVQLLRDPALGRRLGDAGRLLVETNFSQERFARNVLQVYREALRSPATHVRQLSSS